ncbi:hypothetical protein [Azospirillum endophyticum]
MDDVSKAARFPAAAPPLYLAERRTGLLVSVLFTTSACLPPQAGELPAVP